MANNFILKVNNLEQRFKKKRRTVFEKQEYIYPVNNISFNLINGETYGLVGESGSGKSTIALTIMGYHKKTGGDVFFDNIKVDYQNNILLKKIRKDMQIVFQDPLSSLSPRKKINYIIGEPLDAYNLCKTKNDRSNIIYKILDQVGLDENILHKYPSQISGGQNQRVAIARSLTLGPKLIILDEALSALDVSIQAQILNLLEDLKNKLNISYLFISHDLSIVKRICDRVCVLRNGQIVEENTSLEIFNNPKDDYTIKLIESVPKLKYKLNL